MSTRPDVGETARMSALTKVSTRVARRLRSTNLYRLSSPLLCRQVVYGGNRDGIVLYGFPSPNDFHPALILTKACHRQQSCNASPQTTSRSGPSPARRAISRRLRLLSRPIVHTDPLGRSSGSGRYFPLPVPESSPTAPVGKEERNFAMTGHG